MLSQLHSLLECFACGDKSSSSVITPEDPQIIKVKLISHNDSDIKTDDNLSKISMTSLTHITSSTTPTKDQDDDQQICRRIQELRKKQIHQRKAMQSQFIKQNLNRSNLLYLVQTKWTQQYSDFLKIQKYTEMNPINNSSLLDENGELKPDVKQKKDYFVVTQKIWKFVQGLYGGGPCIAKDSTFPVYSLSVKKITLAPVGIQNPLLNLCFVTAVMQMLFSIEQLNGYILRKLFAQKGQQSKKKPYHNILFKFMKQYQQLQTDQDSPSIPIKQFASYFQYKFNPKQQHDAHQFMLSLMQVLQQQMKIKQNYEKYNKNNSNLELLYSQYFKQNKSIINGIFAGQQQTLVTCSACKTQSVTYLPFLQIVLPIKGMDCLQKCIKTFFEQQKLQDLYSCEVCKKKRKASKITCITKTPSYLVIVLKKFSTVSLQKIQNRVKYGFQIDLKQYCIGHCGETNYYLNSIVIHKGSKSNKGHYYTMARRRSKCQWFYFNDNIVKKIQQSDVLGRDPYILVYEREKNP